MKVNTLEVRLPEDVDAMLRAQQQAGRKSILMLVEHAGMERFVAFPLQTP